jgi:hypothetical protein
MAETSPAKTLNQLETVLEEYLVKKAPALPSNIKDILVQLAPWITLILAIMFVPLLLAVLGLSALFLPIAALGGASYGLSYLAILPAAIAFILQVMAIPGLFKRTRSAWKLLFYATLISALASLLQGNLVGMLLGALIGLYLLFQVKSYYH